MEFEITHTIDSDWKFIKSEYSLADMGEVGEEIQAIKEEIINYKSELDMLNVPDKESLLSVYNYFKDFRRECMSNMLISKTSRRMANNSWLKGLEILRKYRIFEKYSRIQAFDTSAVPGFYLFAMSYYARSISQTPFEWTGAYDKSNSHQRDEFGMVRKYEANYIHKGDLTNPRTVKEICDINDHKAINFVMSDYATDTSGNYNNQETFFTPYVIAQIMIIIRSLKKGGSACVKQYSAYEPFTLSYIYVFSSMFENFYIYKPLTSKKQNSEIFLVGLGYKFVGGDCLNQESCCSANGCGFMRDFYKVLREALETKKYVPFVPMDVLTPFVTKIRKLFFDLGVAQVQALYKIIEHINQTSNTTDEIRKILRNSFHEISKDEEKAIWKRYLDMFDGHAFNVRVEKFL